MQTTRPTTRWRLAQWLELRWWRRYLRGQTPQQYLDDKRAYWQRVLRELDWRVEPNERVLDAGCGPAGVFMEVFRQQNVTALDPLLDGYDELAIFDRRDYPSVCFLNLSLEGFRSRETFDSIYCFNAINHVSDWSACLDVLTVAARQGTRMIVTSDVHRHAFLLPVFRALPGDALHPQQHVAEDYRRALSDRGWKIDREVVLRRELIFEYRAWVLTLGS